MSNPSSTPTNPPSLPLIPRERLITVLSSSTRWTMLKALCTEPMGAKELARIAGCTTSAASKHMRVLIEAGIVIYGRGRFYKLAPRFQPPPGQFTFDFGHCVIRLDVESAT